MCDANLAPKKPRLIFQYFNVHSLNGTLQSLARAVEDHTSTQWYNVSGRMWLKMDTKARHTETPHFQLEVQTRDQFQSSKLARTRRQKFKLESIGRRSLQRDRPEADTAKLPDTPRQCPDSNIDAGLILLDPLCLLVTCIAYC